MFIRVYRVSNPKKLPQDLFWDMDGYDDRFWAAFQNYPGTRKIVVAAWGTTGEVKGRAIAALVATRDHIITGYVDLLEMSVASHNEPNRCQRRKEQLAALRHAIDATWLIVHDADTGAYRDWIIQGFHAVEPPLDIPADEAVHVLAWGDLPEDPHALLAARNLSWHRDTHRGFKRRMA